MSPNIFGRRVIVRLPPRISERMDDLTDLRQIPESVDRRLHRVMRTTDVPAQRLVHSTDVQRVRLLERKAKANHWSLDYSLSSYWVLDTRDRPVREARQLARRIRRETGIKAWVRERQREAFAEVDVAEPQRFSGTVQLRGGCRNYLGPAPCGINVSSVWDEGFTGSGTRLVDLEATWDLSHPAFEDVRWIENPRGRQTPLYNDVREEVGKRHGTKVLSLIVGQDDQIPLKGVARCVECGVVSRYRKVDDDQRDIVGAIVAALEVLRWGDILLLECGTRTWLPLEVMEHYHAAIRLAVGNGIIVIEAAGNGGKNLDAVPESRSEWSPSVRLVRGRRSFTDSGAILVGACDPACVLDELRHPQGHRPCYNGPNSGSNYGSRVDCYAWGGGVKVCGDDNFSGTSSAAAIIAGAAALTQEMHVDRGGGRLSPAEMRELLSDPEVGTPSQPMEDGEPLPIGVMPDLEKVWGKIKSKAW